MVAYLTFFFASICKNTKILVVWYHLIVVCHAHGGEAFVALFFMQTGKDLIWYSFDMVVYKCRSTLASKDMFDQLSQCQEVCVPN